VRFASTKSAGDVEDAGASELETVLGLSENAFVVYDRTGAIRLASDRLRNLLELTDAEWQKLRSFSSLERFLTARLAHPQERLEPPWNLWKAGHALSSQQIELAAPERTLERVARPVYNSSGAAAGWVERYRDASAEMELPARLLQTDKLAAMGQLVAGIAHELNNPLTAVMGYGHLLLDRPLDPKALAGVHRICEETDRAARIVRSLLTLAREAKLERIPVQLNEIIERTLWLCTYDLRRAGICAELDLDPILPFTLANPVQLQQIVLNLLVNAQQAIAGTSQSGHITLLTRHSADHIYLQVKDNGPGVPLELQSRIFEPFFTTKPMGVGTGLGLSIVTGILRQHGGDIQVSSVPGSGATFTVTLPIAVAKPESLPAREESPRIASAATNGD
jgi:signal transduction histidine kinase